MPAPQRSKNQSPRHLRERNGTKGMQRAGMSVTKQLKSRPLTGTDTITRGEGVWQQGRLSWSIADTNGGTRCDVSSHH